MRYPEHEKLKRTAGRLAIAALLALPLNFAGARPLPVTVPLPLVSGGSVTGPARVLDGDTIDIDGTRVRLEGIDAPENGQECARREGGSWRCGTAATKALTKMIAGRSVRCDSMGTDKYHRMLGVCYVDGRQINDAMVRDGHAWAFVKYSNSYVAAEADAKARGFGIWQAPTQAAWDYRSNRWASAEGNAPNGCAIKGNITSRGRIYHMPWSPWYGRVRIEPEKGERWFCSEAEAMAAGWRGLAER